MNWSDRIHGLDFGDYGIFHKNVQPESKIDPLPVIVHGQGKLRSRPKAALPQFMGEANFVYALQQSWSKRCMNLHRRINHRATDLIKVLQPRVLCGSSEERCGKSVTFVT
jgi:hypothetical protein